MSLRSISTGAFRAMLLDTPLGSVGGDAAPGAVDPGCPLTRLSAKLAAHYSPHALRHFGAEGATLLGVAVCSPLAGGNSNSVFLIRSVDNSARFPPVVYREYGPVGDIVCREREMRVSKIVAENGMAPNIHFSFNDGRVEQFLDDASCATAEQLLDPESCLLGHVFRAVHNLHKIDWTAVTGGGLHLPHHNEPSIHRVLQKLLRCIEKLFVANPHRSAKDLVAEWTKEVAWLTAASSERPALVTSHNDLNPGNILYRVGPNNAIDELYLIDFEYSDVNLPCFDIGNILCELELNYSRGVHGFAQPLRERRASRGAENPSIPVLAAIIRTLTAGDDLLDSEESSVGQHILRALTQYDERSSASAAFLRDIYFGMLCSHMMWGLWAVVVALQGRKSEDALNTGASGLQYDAYGHSRLSEYSVLKDWMMENRLFETGNKS